MRTRLGAKPEVVQRPTVLGPTRWVLREGQVEVLGVDMAAERVAAGLGAPSPIIEVTAALQQARPLLGLREGADLTRRVLAGAGLVGAETSTLKAVGDPLALVVLAAVDRSFFLAVGCHHREKDWRRLGRALLVPWALAAGIARLGSLAWLASGIAIATALVMVAAIVGLVVASGPHVRISLVSVYPPRLPGRTLVSCRLRWGPPWWWRGSPQPFADVARAPGARAAETEGQDRVMSGDHAIGRQDVAGLDGVRWLVERERVVVRGADIEAERAAEGLGAPSRIAAVSAAATVAAVVAGAEDGDDLTERVLAGARMVGHGLGAVAGERDLLVLMVVATLDGRLSAEVGRHPSFRLWRRRLRDALGALACEIAWVAFAWPGGLDITHVSKERVLAAACVLVGTAAYALVAGAVAAWAMRPHLRIRSEETAENGVTTRMGALACRRLRGLAWFWGPLAQDAASVAAGSGRGG